MPLDRDGVLRAAEELLAQGVETLAVSFLWSHLNPVHEDAARELLDEPLPGPLRQLRLACSRSGSASTRAPRPRSSTPTSAR